MMHATKLPRPTRQRYNETETRRKKVKKWQSNNSAPAMVKRTCLAAQRKHAGFRSSFMHVVSLSEHVAHKTSNGAAVTRPPVPTAAATGKERPIIGATKQPATPSVAPAKPPVGQPSGGTTAAPDASTTVDNASVVNATDATAATRDDVQSRKRQLTSSASVPASVLHSEVIDTMYTSEQASKKRALLRGKALDRVTSVPEAFEVCLFQAENQESQEKHAQNKLNALVQTLADMHRSKASAVEILRTKDRIRELRTEITKMRTTYQTPLDVLVNVAKFSQQMRHNRDAATAAKHASHDQKRQEARHTIVGTVATLRLATGGALRQCLQTYAQTLAHDAPRDTSLCKANCSAADSARNLPPLQYDKSNSLMLEIAREFVENDRFNVPHLTIMPDDAKRVGTDHAERPPTDGESDDIIDDRRRDEWLANNALTMRTAPPMTQRLREEFQETVLAGAHESVVEHATLSHTYSTYGRRRQTLAKEAADKVAKSARSLLFQVHGDGKRSIESLAAAGNKRAASAMSMCLPNIGDAGEMNGGSDGQQIGKKARIEMVRIGSKKTSHALGGKTRNRVRNRMKPARNAQNVSIVNFLRVQVDQMSEKHVLASKFVDFMQRCGPQENQSDGVVNKSVLTKHLEEQERRTGGHTTLQTGASHNQQNDCGNASKHLPLPNYGGPACRYCGSAVHVSSRTGLETCTSSSCSATVYMPTGHDLVHLEQQVHNTYQYLLVVHMKTTLRRSQAKETSRVPDRIIDAVSERLRMERADLSKVTAKRVKKVLNKLDLTAWYNHKHQICARITGHKPHQFSTEEEDIILAIFERLIEPYNMYRSKSDENFPYYSYALHKILQLLNYPKSVLQNYPLLKDQKIHRKKEAIWAKMMDKVGWPYIKSEI